MASLFSSEIVEPAVAYGFYLNGDEARAYFPISFDERKEYGLVPTWAQGLTKNNLYQIREDDVGEFMGFVKGCADTSLNGCKVYYFSKYPEAEGICIVDTPDGYQFYTCDWLDISNKVGESLDVILEMYELPESLEEIKVYTSDNEFLFEIKDEAKSARIMEILSGKINGEKNPAVWYEVERQIEIHTSDGYRLFIYYYPEASSFFCKDGYYKLSAAEAEEWNSILQIK